MIKRFGPPFIETKVPVLWHFGSSVRRSRFFGISALRFEGPGSLAFRLFGSKVLVLSSTTSALWHSVPHFGSKVPVLSSATSALCHFGFTYRKKEKGND